MTHGAWSGQSAPPEEFAPTLLLVEGPSGFVKFSLPSGLYIWGSWALEPDRRMWAPFPVPWVPSCSVLGQL